MKIVFYSTNSNTFNKDTFLINVLPSNQSVYDDFVSKFPEHEFFCISQSPAMFMPEKSTLILPQDFTALQVAEKILEVKPNLAIAMTFWVSPYDWLTVNDALVAEELEKNGIQCISHNLNTGLICFDKWKTHQYLDKLGFTVAEGIYVDHDLYFCAGSHKEVLNNVYRQSIKSQLTKLKLPLIIKDTAGLSSYGMTVVHTYGEAVCYLNSKRNNSNRLVEEYIEGQQFGLEVYGVPGNYTVLSPFRFSLNQYGITSPKQSSKFGPCTFSDDLESKIKELAESLELKGAAQIDLIYDGSKWYIIEINPRLSGMTFTYASSIGISVYEMLFRTCVLKEDLKTNKMTLNIKLPIVSIEKMKELLCFKGITLLNQTNDLEAKQEREKGFCECVITGNNLCEIENCVEKLKELFPEEATILQSESILK